MALTVLRHRDRLATPWANGGGITYEALRSPAGDGPFDWRISFAEVATEGPFSYFPGIERTLVIVDGAGMTLDMDGQLVAVPPHSPIHFAGEVLVVGLLPHGPVSDCNVMVRRGRYTAEVTILRGTDLDVQPAEGAMTIVAVLAGQWELLGEEEPLGVRDCVRVHRPLRLGGVGGLAHIRIGTA